MCEERKRPWLQALQMRKQRKGSKRGWARRARREGRREGREKEERRTETHHGVRRALLRVAPRARPGRPSRPHVQHHRKRDSKGHGVLIGSLHLSQPPSSHLVLPPPAVPSSFPPSLLPFLVGGLVQQHKEGQALMLQQLVVLSMARGGRRTGRQDTLLLLVLVLVLVLVLLFLL